MIYNMYIFDRHCVSIFYIDWHRNRKSTSTTVTNSGSGNASMIDDNISSTSPPPTISHLMSHHSTTSQLTNTSMLSDSRLVNLDEEAKLVYGVVFSLRNFVRKLSGR